MAMKQASGLETKVAEEKSVDWVVTIAGDNGGSKVADGADIRAPERSAGTPMIDDRDSAGSVDLRSTIQRPDEEEASTHNGTLELDPSYLLTSAAVRGADRGFARSRADWRTALASAAFRSGRRATWDGILDPQVVGVSEEEESKRSLTSAQLLRLDVESGCGVGSSQWIQLHRQLAFRVTIDEDMQAVFVVNESASTAQPNPAPPLPRPPHHSPPLWYSLYQLYIHTTIVDCKDRRYLKGTPTSYPAPHHLIPQFYFIILPAMCKKKTDATKTIEKTRTAMGSLYGYKLHGGEKRGVQESGETRCQNGGRGKAFRNVGSTALRQCPWSFQLQPPK
ncbi:hypothetical protein HDU93_008880 [Gonapodya sp. JEL0774]|nr:hypothetical protein HDU93_008880 [Gonapodya sp. JEL0774]